MPSLSKITSKQHFDCEQQQQIGSFILTICKKKCSLFLYKTHPSFFQTSWRVAHFPASLEYFSTHPYIVGKMYTPLSQCHQKIVYIYVVNFFFQNIVYFSNRFHSIEQISKKKTQISI